MLLGWPNPFPQWFGFHEVFHALVIMGCICHFIAIYCAVVKISHVTALAAATLQRASPLTGAATVLLDRNDSEHAICIKWL